MHDDKLKKIENIFHEMYDLRIELRVLRDLAISARINIKDCELNGYEAGAKVWTAVRNDYTDRQEMISIRIKDLYAEATRLKAEIGA